MAYPRGSGRNQVLTFDNRFIASYRDMSVPFQYSRHYTLEEAREMIPHIEQWLGEIHALNLQQEECRRWQHAMFEEGHDLGGNQIEAEVRNLSRLLHLLQEFKDREILITDLSRGHVDFPSMNGSEEVLLCWEMGQSDIMHWHALNSDSSDRKPV